MIEMLIKDYYSIDNATVTDDGKGTFEVSLNPECMVYQGHFPGNPVSPGVCNIQMIIECARQLTGKQLMLSNLQQCRLTTLITPQTHSRLKISLATEPKGDVIKLKADISDDTGTCLEMKAEMSIEDL